MTISKLTFRFVLAVLMLMATACGSDDENSAGEGAEVMILFNPNGLGDRSYNDNILEGVYSMRVKYARDPSVNVSIVVPTSNEHLLSSMQDWFSTQTTTRRLLILCSSFAADCLATHPEWTKKDGDDILLLDTRHSRANFYTRFLSLYGASHLSGQMVRLLGVSKSAVILANNHDQAILNAAKGFAEGFRLQGGTFSETDDVRILSDQAGSGYDLADSLFRLSYTLDQQGYRFVYPLCGGSSQGLFRYTRHFLVLEGADPFYTCGMDVDQQEYSRRVGFSVLKRYDLLVQDFVDKWLARQSQQLHLEQGIESDYVDFVVAHGFEQYESVSQPRLEQMMKASIEAEQQFLNH